ncbi:DUF2914 domain-containing protein [Candidatus Nomurabacteria bacterium]|nr:DUF2914 domain-containing protein [Candidatus Nomurabacteria bacterium]
MPFVDPIRNFYGRFERPISSLSLISGFIFDIITLKRVDTLWENIWILGHLFIIGIFIILIHSKDNEEGDEANPSKAHFWYVNILQFFFGGILSTYLVFYFRSADLFSTWPFILILLLAFIANESLKRHFIRLSFQISLFFLSIYSFMIFLVPIVLHRIGDWVFVLSGILSLIIIWFFLRILFKFIKENKKNRKAVTLLISGIFILVNFLYFTNMIPPMPLSLKDAGVYYNITKNIEGNYELMYENTGWKKYLDLYPDFNKVAGMPVYVFSAIFSPKNLNLNIIHEWQHYNEARKEWQTESVVNLPVVGGRDGGFRTYSMRSNISAGKWRVNIKTNTGKTIGHLRFNIVPAVVPPIFSVVIK